MPLSPRRVQIIPPQAMYFDGVDDYVLIPNNPSLQIVGDLTIELLYMPTNVAKGRQNPIDKAYYGEFAVTQEPDGRISAYFGNCLTYSYAAYTSQPNTAVNNVWIHFTLTRIVSARQFLYYVNGKQGSWLYQSSWVDPTATSNNVFIGKGYAGYLAGYMAVVRLYSRALSQDEILWNYTYPDNPVRNGLVLWLHWDSIDANGGKWYDKSGYGNHGTIYGATLVQIIKSPRRVLTSSRALATVR